MLSYCFLPTDKSLCEKYKALLFLLKQLVSTGSIMDAPGLLFVFEPTVIIEEENAI
jgi:hypothetical protein